MFGAMLARSDLELAVSRAIREIGKMDLFLFYLRIEKGVSIGDLADIAWMSQDQVSARLKKIYDRIERHLAL